MENGKSPKSSNAMRFVLMSYTSGFDTTSDSPKIVRIRGQIYANTRISVFARARACVCVYIL